MATGHRDTVRMKLSSLTGFDILTLSGNTRALFSEVDVDGQTREF